MKNWVIALLALATSPAWSANDCFKTCTTSQDGISTIQFFEGFSPFVYKDSAGLDTIGYGHLLLPHERIDEPLLGHAAVALLRSDLTRTEKGLNQALTRRLRTNQFDALSSFAFNVGVGACTRSTLFRYVNAGRHGEVPAQFARWVYAGGKPIAGLKARRAREAKLYAK